jgi:hypothetical protein
LHARRQVDLAYLNRLPGVAHVQQEQTGVVLTFLERVAPRKVVADRDQASPHERDVCVVARTVEETHLSRLTCDVQDPDAALTRVLVAPGRSVPATPVGAGD